MGGWLLVTHAFHLHRQRAHGEWLGSGFSALYRLEQPACQFLPLTLAFWVRSLMIFLAGVACAWRSNLRPWLEKRDLHAIPLTDWPGGLTVLFTLILRGQSIFDEYLHLPLISIMAAGIFHPTSTSTQTFILPTITASRCMPPAWCAWQASSPGLPGISAGPWPLPSPWSWAGSGCAGSPAADCSLAGQHSVHLWWRDTLAVAASTCTLACIGSARSVHLVGTVSIQPPP